MKTRMVTPRRALTDATMLAVSAPDCMVWEHPTGAGVVKSGAYVPFGLAGSPDIIGVCRGRFMGLEIKTPGDTVKPDQRRFRAAFEAAGGVYVIVRDPADAVAAVAQIRGAA